MRSICLFVQAGRVTVEGKDWRVLAMDGIF